MVPTDDILIPRIIHRVWVGSDPMPEVFERYGETWRNHHPHWEMKLWTDDNLPPLEYPHALQRARSANERSNLLRYEALREYGGVYVDTDFECMKALDSLLPGIKVFVARSASGGVKNSIIGAVPHHPFMETIVRESSELVGSHEGPWHPGLKPTGQKLLQRLVPDFADVIVFGSEKFFPYSQWETPRPSHEYVDAYAIHHWARTGRVPETLSADELRSTIVLMREKYTRVKDRKAKKKVQAERARRSADKLSARADKLAARLSATESRLAAIERSLWWRLRPTRLLGRGERRGRSGTGRSQ
jgi:Glycosyltransferase sugar-binding region containing DXD motif